MSYPGNPSLSSAVQDRVVSTFRQALVLHHQGRVDEVMAGCTLILQMDPMFDPARKLIEKLRNPALPIDVDSLLPQDSNTALQQARDAMAARDFERVVHLTTEILTNDLLNDEARILGDEAREKLEAAPFVEQFARKCDQHLAGGNVAAAKMDLEKARALDPTHPDVLRVARAIDTRGATPAPAFTPSFIVDEPAQPQSGRAAAPAADFGFSFEEEKPAEVSFSDFSFDSPAEKSADAPFGGFSFGAPEPPAAPAAPSASASEFDFATAAVVTSSDDQKKIEQYLSDGDRAAAAGDYHQAIDLWSRIFLIDVTNDDASERIERAKAKRREIDQKVEPLLNAGILAFERGDTAKAHSDLSEVLRLDPQNSSAQEYLDRLGETLPDSAAAASKAYVPPTSDDLAFFEDEPVAGTETPLVPPDVAPSTAKSAPAKKAPAKATGKGDGRRVSPVALAGVIGLLVLLAAGWFVWTRFMNKPEGDAGAGQAIITRAATLAGNGRYDEAIALLQDIQPDDPQHDEALVMIADLRTKKASSSQLINGVPAQQFFADKIAEGRRAFEAHDYAGAKAAFEQAQRVKPLPPDMKAQLDASSQQMAKLDAARTLFTEQKYSEAIANLQQLLQQDPQNVTVQRMIHDAHFNMGVRALQQERLDDAVRSFDQVLAANPNDELAKRSRDLAVRYEGEKKDLLYQIYVKYLPLRQPA